MFWLEEEATKNQLVMEKLAGSLGREVSLCGLREPT
jgi:hypothetical protein